MRSLSMSSMAVSASGGVSTPRSTRYVAVLAWTAAAVTVEAPALSLRIVDAEGAVTASSWRGGRSPGRAPDAVGRREETAVVDCLPDQFGGALASLIADGKMIDRQPWLATVPESMSWSKPHGVVLVEDLAIAGGRLAAEVRNVWDRAGHGTTVPFHLSCPAG
jgi:hypothetical protein